MIDEMVLNVKRSLVHLFEVAEHVFVDGLSSAPDNNGVAVEVRPRCTSAQERRAVRCQTWNKDEVGLTRSYRGADVQQYQCFQNDCL